MNIIHITHEAVEKVGGIGAVIAGLTNAHACEGIVDRTVLVGPLFDNSMAGEKRLGAEGNVIYSTLDDIRPDEYARKFHAIERTYDVGLVYGTRFIEDPCTGRKSNAEVLLVDVFHCNPKRLALFKKELFQKFAVPSDKFEAAWEYEQYVRLAEPAYDALKAIDCVNSHNDSIILAHEYMGMPTALRASLDSKANLRTVFYAHEVASVRPVVEAHPGHDSMFYNIMERRLEKGETLEQKFPSVLENFKHPLVKAARYCDHIFAVGDQVCQELKFLDGHFHDEDIDLVYNGIPAMRISLQEKQASRERLKQYGENLFGYKSDWIFTHVCRPVRSKAIWRDLAVLHHIDKLLQAKGQIAIYFMLGTLAGQRRSRDVKMMERAYGWPVAHEKGYPDLCGGEEVLGEMFDPFNRSHEAVRAVLVNQWDWNRYSCGKRMPEDMTFADIRHGSDVEFGMSIYEPYGIAQFEPLSFGAICAITNVCGCAGFAKSIGGQDSPCVIEANFVKPAENLSDRELLEMTISQRDSIEADETERVARLIVERLPDNDEKLQKYIDLGYELATKMSWENVVTKYFLPALHKVEDESLL